MTVAVCDQIKLNAQILNGAKQQIVYIFADAGVAVSWVDLDRQARCSIPPGERSYFVVVLLPNAAHNKIAPDAMGTSPIASSMYPRAYIFYNRVEHFVDQVSDRSYPRNNSLAVILGYAMAHELGHLLIPGDVHALTGIMSGNWNVQQWYGAVTGTLLFDEWEANAIRERLQRR